MIPPRKNAKPWKKKWVGAAVCTEALRACQRLGRGIWKKWNGYHRRSLVETKIYCFKRLGERVMARTPDLTTTAARDLGAAAFAIAGMTPANVQATQLYDAPTINVLLFLEDLGFCAKGEGGAFVTETGIGPGGKVPINTNGGGAVVRASWHVRNLHHY